MIVFFLLGTDVAVEEMLFGDVDRFTSWKGSLYQLVKTGLEMFDVSSPAKLQDYLTYLADEMNNEGTHSVFYIQKKKKNSSYNVKQSVTLSLLLCFFFDYSLCY